MLKHTLAAAVFSACFAAPVNAQTEAPPAVDTMTCEQLAAELTVAGQRMNSQLDPEFATEGAGVI